MLQEINLESLTPAELRALNKRIDKELEGRSERQRREKAIADLESRAAKKWGYSASELFTSAKETSGPKILPKYQNPANALQKWSGRGRQPRWVREHLESGGEMSDLSIK